MSTRSTRPSRAARTTIAVVAAGLVVLAVAGCGGGGTYGGSTSSSKPTPSSGGGPSIKLASTKLGNVLVDADGRTLYLFEADKGPMSVCGGGCAGVWPPLTTTGQPTAGPGVSASKLGTTKRSAGVTEVTYNGHPLYTYAGDSAPGETSGQGLDDYGAEWYALSAGGNKVDNG